MSGRPFYKRGGFVNTLSRRSFLLKAGIITTGILLNGCIRRLKPNGAYKNIKGSMKGPNAKAGHILRDKLPLPAPIGNRKVKTLIIGGGISGLSAARWLKRQGYNDFELLELEDHVGGNSHSGKNGVSPYPLGAHYITIANNDDTLLTGFLQDCGVIIGFENNLPVYNDYYLCFDPEERLLINGQWQEGIVPDFGLQPGDKAQIKQFFALVDELKKAKGNDGKYAFDIPIDNSSADEKYRALDSITFKEYLHQQKLTSVYLHWYLNYCCKDDYGQKIDKVSAWAGMHYFASRRGKAANADTNAVLTWPEGNGWLTKKLAADASGHIIKGHMCYSIAHNAQGKVVTSIYDIAKGTTSLITADNVIMATPQFVNQRLFKDHIIRPVDYASLNYSPWFIANITVNSLPQAKGTGLCWDNVAYDTPSVGYVNAGQQSVKLTDNKRVLTWYLPLCDHEPRIARLAAYTRTYEQWMDIMMPELEYMHPGITDAIENVECWVWGHGMIYPAVNHIWGANRKAAQQPVNNNVFFANTDLSGISIFEEAFHQGIRAASQVLANYGKQAIT
ncbi:FAD-dependent oxidoreductase [Mucilaginibacter psychrotolerans]|uniref:FAD-dependent oxidoreductase n=1 Tax=Mucilaginibacter psychrotolerans TaxID=1524096 RepID=A0A4Y8SMQ5_9SPHI|nr:FAD-dependent oxidoreductase [Mucilaginibacter psychrotolerans]TFF40198.1 FAD-dependent oxidoreductase [Mucilaginibacter psychrotolerans]